jgi:hypothetical protein
MNVNDEVHLVMFDTLDMGGLIAAASLSHLVPLFHLLGCLDKDVYYAIDTVTNVSDVNNPSLVLSVKKKHPGMAGSSLLWWLAVAWCLQTLFSGVFS